MTRVFLAAVFVLAGCGSTPQPPDWQLNASQGLEAFQRNYLVGNTRASEADFALAKSELARTGREDLVARAELVRCALRTASLEFDECPAFEALRSGARAEEIAYADYLAGRAPRVAAEDPLSRLVAAGVQLKTGGINPATISSAVEIASAQGWRRPLLAWLGVQIKRAEDAGDSETAAGLRRRIKLISG